MRTTGSVLGTARVAARPSNTVLDTHLAKRRHQDYRRLAIARHPLKLSISANFSVYDDSQSWAARILRPGMPDVELQRAIAHLATPQSSSRYGAAPWNDRVRRRSPFHVAAVGRRDAAHKRHVHVAASAEALALEDPLDAVIESLLEIGRRWDVEDGFCASAAFADVRTVHHDRFPPALSPPPALAAAREGPGSVLGFLWERDVVGGGGGEEGLRTEATSLPRRLVSSAPRWRWVVRETRQDTGSVIKKLQRLGGVEMLGLTTATFWKCLCALASTDGVSVTPGLTPALLTAVSEHYQSLSPPLRQLECLRMVRSILTAEAQQRRNNNNSSSISDDNRAHVGDALDDLHRAAGPSAVPCWVTPPSVRAADQVATVCPRLTAAAWRGLPPLFHYLLRRRRSPLDAVDALFLCLSLCAESGLRRRRLPLADLASMLPMRCRNGAVLYLFLRHVLRLQPVCKVDGDAGAEVQPSRTATTRKSAAVVVGERAAGYHETSFVDLVAALRVATAVGVENSSSSGDTLSSTSSLTHPRQIATQQQRRSVLKCALAVVTDVVAESVLLAMEGVVGFTNRGAEISDSCVASLPRPAGTSVMARRAAAPVGELGEAGGDVNLGCDDTTPPTVSRSVIRVVESLEWATCWFEAIGRGVQSSKNDEARGGCNDETTTHDLQQRRQSSCLWVLCDRLEKLRDFHCYGLLGRSSEAFSFNDSHTSQVIKRLLQSRAIALLEAVAATQSMVSSSAKPELSCMLTASTASSNQLDLS